MAYSYDIDEAAPKLPSLPHDIQRAKMFLMKHTESGDCLYDHLSELLSKILSERPKNAVEVFENYSRKLKDLRIRKKSNLPDVYLPPSEYSEAEKLIKLFQTRDEINETDANGDNDDENIPPDLIDLFNYLEQINISLPKSEIILLNLSIEKLVKERPIINVRFWGKVLGRPKNYYVVEAEFNQEELSRRLEFDGDVGEEEKEDEANEEETRTIDEVERSEDAGINVSKSDENESTSASMPPAFGDAEGTVVVPSEPIGSGVNKKVFFVCNSPGLDDWVELPPVTPKQIIVSRKIIGSFTGCLESPVFTYPEFPGNEANYLRSQIARISATTLVSPIGYFTFGKGEEDVEEEEIEEEEMEDENGKSISVNSHYDPLPTKELTDPSLSNWCHHSDYILEQGRTVWWNPGHEEEEDEEVEEEEPEDNENSESEKKVMRQIGPALLTPLSEDSLIDTIPPWTTRVSSKIHKYSTIALVRSNLWPGAVAFAKDTKIGNIYIGNGMKFTTKNYAPTIPQIPQEEYKLGPEIMEMQEPSFEAEEAYRIAHLTPTKLSDSEEEGEEEDVEEDSLED